MRHLDFVAEAGFVRIHQSYQDFTVVVNFLQNQAILKSHLRQTSHRLQLVVCSDSIRMPSLHQGILLAVVHFLQPYRRHSKILKITAKCLVVCLIRILSLACFGLQMCLSQVLDLETSFQRWALMLEAKRKSQRLLLMVWRIHL